ncbi:MAG TPA: hypothetical protein VE548_08615 [Nitrososphaeraceae archaeon]|jgi:hypothetical protein|nr:hypothetical protein [Nitrososphaeraceae archaeon]
MENIQFQQMVCGTWYPQTCKFLKLKHHHIHLPYGKSIIERTIQYVKVELNVSMITILVEMKEEDVN